MFSTPEYSDVLLLSKLTEFDEFLSPPPMNSGSDSVTGDWVTLPQPIRCRGSKLQKEAKRRKQRDLLSPSSWTCLSKSEITLRFHKSLTSC